MSPLLSAVLTVRELFLSACEGGELELVRSLLSHGADVNWVEGGERLGRSGLHLAASMKAGPLVDLLLAQPGVSVNIRDKNDLTPLMAACVTGSADIVRKLLEVEGVDLTCRDEVGWTALHTASLVSEDCARLLVQDSRVELKGRNKAGDTLLLHCLKNNKVELAKMILNKPSVDLHTPDEDGMYPETIARWVDFGYKLPYIVLLSPLFRELDQREVLDLIRRLSLRGLLLEKIPECPVGG